MTYINASVLVNIFSLLQIFTNKLKNNLFFMAMNSQGFYPNVFV